MDESYGHQRRAKAALAVMALALPWLILGAFRTMDGIHTSALGWLAEDDDQRQRYQWFIDNFEDGAFIVVSWDGCSLADSRLTTLEQNLDPSTSPLNEDQKSLIGRIYSGRSIVAGMAQPPLRLSRSAAIERLQGALIGADGATTCLAVVLSEEGALRRADSIALILEQASAATNLDSDDLYLVGPPVDAWAIDRESNRNVDYFSGPSAALCLVLSWWCLRSVRLSAAILMVAGFGQVMMLGSLWYFSVTMDAVLIVLPPLVFVLTVSAGVHMANYYFDRVRSGAGVKAPDQAFRQALFPCSLAAVTTAIGLGSLSVSRIVPVATFGVFAAWGVLITVALLFFTLPGAMSRWPIPAEQLRQAAPTSSLRRRLDGIAQFVCRRATTVTFAGVVILIVGSMGLNDLRTSISVRSLFAPDSRVIRDFTWMETNIGALVPLEIILEFPATDDSRMIDRLRIVQGVEAAVEQMGDVETAMSVATFSPDFPRSGRLGSVMQRSLYDGRLRRHREQLIESNYLQETDAGQYWRISARVSGLKNIDYEVIIKRLREKLDPMIQRVGDKLAPGLTAIYTGTMPVVYRAQHTLLEDMLGSLFTAFLLVWLVLCVLLADFSQLADGRRVTQITGRSVNAIWLGGLAMLPNVFPIVVVFGAMGWAGMPADIGSTMTACVALGIAVDDTLHFLAWFRRETAAGATRVDAIGSAFHHCGRAMVQTTLICGVGLLVFGLSGFVPTKRFAWLMFTLLTAALAADLIFLPAILASPLGRKFAVPKQPDIDDTIAAA